MWRKSSKEHVPEKKWNKTQSSNNRSTSAKPRCLRYSLPHADPWVLFASNEDNLYGGIRMAANLCFQVYRIKHVTKPYRIPNIQMQC